MSFFRRYDTFPDAAELGKIEGVVIVDEAPTGVPVGPGVSTVCYVAETEDGGFATDPEKPADVYHPRGGLIDVPRDRYVATIGGFGFTVNGTKFQYPCARRSAGEDWNGNAYVHSKGLAFRRFLVARVDTSIGAVVFSPLAFLETPAAGPWSLTTGQTLVASVNGAGNVTATFTGTPATVTGSAASFATLAPGDSATISIDGAPVVTTTFQAGDTTIGAVVIAINRAFGAPIATNAAGQLALTSPTGGTSSHVQIVSGSGTTIAKLGHAVGTTNGAGNVASIAAVTAAELKSIGEADLTGSAIRITPKGTARLCSATGGSGTIKVDASSTATAFGFTSGTTTSVAASSGAKATSIPAGSLVSAGTAATRCVTMQSLSLPALNIGAVTAKVRPAVDDGTFGGSGATTLTTLETVPSTTAEFSVSNPASVSAALSDVAKDALYQDALDATLRISGVASKVNYIASARQSNACRVAVVANAKAASARSAGRKARIAPPLGTSLATMIGSGAPAVGTYRHERVRYSPGARKRIAELALLASAGDVTLPADGEVDVHGDIVACSLDSLLPSEQNIGQITKLLPDTYVGVESAIATWGEEDYVLARAAGISAPIWSEDDKLAFESDVTTVDAATYPSQVPGARVKFADELTDTVATFQRKAVKTPGTPKRKDAVVGQITAYLEGLVKAERCVGYTVALGTPISPRIPVVNWAAEPTPSMDTIVNRTIIGDGALDTQRVGQ